MTNQEFGDWIRKVRSRFPQVARFLDGMDKEDKNNTSIFWFERTAKFDAGCCDHALDAVFNAEKRVFPADWFQAFMRAAKEARGEQSRRSSTLDGQPLTDCRFGCSDDGIVFVVGVTPKAFEHAMQAVKAWLANPDDQRRLFLTDKATAANWSDREWRAHLGKIEPLAMACACGKGERLHGQGLRRFRPGHDQLARDIDKPAPAQHWSTQKDFVGGDAA